MALGFDEKTAGKCAGCGKEFAMRAMGTHISKCGSLAGANDATVLLVKSPHLRAYWLYLSLSGKATLGDLDSLLRDVWVECCEHLSTFRAKDGIEYASEGWEENGFEENMRPMRKTNALKVLPAGASLSYEYDMGTTTELEVQSLATRRFSTAKKIAILARNNPPAATCDKCGAKAELAVAEGCTENDGQAFCKKCARGIDEDETPLLPIVNSPRTGQCGYTGKPYE